MVCKFEPRKGWLLSTAERDSLMSRSQFYVQLRLKLITLICSGSEFLHHKLKLNAWGHVKELHLCSLA